jgi:methylenetetrahydrofolate dehydrogenase (NADP+)/methenyltetrahydrofolate cyclohydrolase
MLLSGRDIAEFIKERHFHQVQAMDSAPTLAIVMSTTADMATRTYVKSTKSRYAAEIGAQVDVHEVAGDTAKVVELIGQLNEDTGVDAIIVQLPFAGVDTEQVIAAVDPHKDVDGLGPDTAFDPATPKAILWLLGGYNIDYKGKTVAMVGQGRLVGKPLAVMFEDSGATVVRCDAATADLRAATLEADIIVTATGHPKLITAGMVKPGSVIIDAGTAEIDGNLVGDVDHALYDDESLKITPNPGGVGPLTVAALFDNVLIAARGRRG